MTATDQQSNGTEPETFDDETQALLEELAEIAEYLAPVEAKYARRAEIYMALRERQPPVKHRVIGEYSDSTEEAVIQAIRKAKRDAAR